MVCGEAWLMLSRALILVPTVLALLPAVYMAALITSAVVGRCVSSVPSITNTLRPAYTSGDPLCTSAVVVLCGVPVAFGIASAVLVSSLVAACASVVALCSVAVFVYIAVIVLCIAIALAVTVEIVPSCIVKPVLSAVSIGGLDVTMGRLSVAMIHIVILLRSLSLR